VLALTPGVWVPMWHAKPTGPVFFVQNTSCVVHVLLLAAQASAGAGTDTRRVGPFTVDPKAARRLLMSHIESTERKRAEAEIARLTGAQQVR
jgi:hypothetical protein